MDDLVPRLYSSKEDCRAPTFRLVSPNSSPPNSAAFPRAHSRSALERVSYRSAIATELCSTASWCFRRFSSR